jgi:uncharacterized protein involved in response to NO
VLTTALSAGFRLFFLFAALNAFFSMAPWLFLLAGGAVPTQGWPPQTLHAHEMLYGTVAAAIAGFLLTAVPNWTRTPPVGGARLAALVALWWAGRIALVLSGPVPPIAVAVVDVAFLPVLAAAVGWPIARSGSHRNLGVVAALLLLAVANATVHAGLLTHDASLLRTGTVGAVYAGVGLMLIISGRLVPLFTRNALARQGLELKVATPPGVGALAVGAALSALALDLIQVGNDWSAWLALAAAPLLLVRQSGWQPRRALADPMLWILHLGHLWIAIGFGLHGLQGLLGGFAGAGALHAFTAGAMGTLILGVMPRVALGHTGRAIAASPMTRVMFWLVTLGAVMRVAGALTTGPGYRHSILLGGALWSIAWLLFCYAYGKILLGPRVDAERIPTPKIQIQGVGAGQ